MRLTDFKQVPGGNHLHMYELTYENKNHKQKKYEMVSRKQITRQEEIGHGMDGMSIVAFKEGKMLLLNEFRMAVNMRVYNLCAGLIEKGESIMECVQRELYEETGLRVKRIIDQLPECFAAVAISDVRTGIIFVEVEGEIEDHSSANEDIVPVFLSKEEMQEAINTSQFASRAQLIAYFFSKGLLDQFLG